MKTTSFLDYIVIVCVACMVIMSGVGCDSIFSRIAQSPTHVEELPSPFLFQATAGEKKVDLSWKIPTHSVELNVQLLYSTTAYPTSISDGQVVYQGSGDSISHSSLTDNQTYFYTLYSFSGSENSESVKAMATPTDMTSPGLVTQVNTTAITNQVSLEWKNPTGFESTDLVNVLVSTESFPVTPSVTEQIIYSGTGESYIHTNLTNDQVYYYCIFTKDSLNNYSEAKRAVATPKDVTAPGTVTGMQITATTNSIEMAWTNPTDVDFLGLMIRRSIITWPMSITDGEELYLGVRQSYIDSNLTANTTYYYGFFCQDKLSNWSIPLTTSAKTVGN